MTNEDWRALAAVGSILGNALLAFVGSRGRKKTTKTTVREEVRAAVRDEMRPLAARVAAVEGRVDELEQVVQKRAGVLPYRNGSDE